MRILCLAGDSHEMSILIFLKNNKINFRMLCATSLLSTLILSSLVATSSSADKLC